MKVEASGGIRRTEHSRSDESLLMASSILYRIAKRAFLLDVTQLLVTENRIPFDSGDFEFFRLSSDDIVRHAKDPVLDLDAGMATRLDCGLDYCFGVFDKSELAGYCWVAKQNIEPKHNQGSHPKTGVALSFGSGTGYVYKAFTHPHWRGQKVLSRLLGFAAQELERCGIERFITTTDWDNHSALRAFERSGFENIGKIWQVARLSSTTIGPAKADAMGIQIGTAATYTERIQPTESKLQASTQQSTPSPKTHATV